MFNLNLEKDYYIVDCYDFVYFPRIVHLTGGFEYSFNSVTLYEVNCTDFITNELKILSETELTRFDSFDKCKEYAEYLNNIPENKKRAEDWKNQGKILIEIMKKRINSFKKENLK